MAPRSAVSKLPQLQREYIEAQVVALATVRPDLASALDELLGGRYLSVTATGVLEAIVADPAGAWESMPGDLRTDGERSLFLNAKEFTVWEVTSYSVDTLVRMVEQLPPIDARQVAA